MKSHFRIFLCVALAIVGLTTGAEAKVINVPSDFETIQEAIDNADRFDEVVIATGTYFENNLNLRKTQMTVRSTDPSDPTTVAETIIDGGGLDPIFVFEQGEKRNSIISGLTLTNGFAEQGGAITISQSSPTLDRLVITGNTAEKGGGIACFGAQSAPLIVGTEISNNQAIGSEVLADPDDVSPELRDLLQQRGRESEAGVLVSVGGGMKVVECSPEIRDSVISGNSAGQGAGAFFRRSRVKIIDSQIIDNEGFWGGGLHFRQAPFATVSSSVFSGNIAIFGGGAIGIEESDLTLEAIEVFNNVGEGFGGGIVISKASPRILSSLIYDNQTFSDGGGIAVFNTTTPEITNSTLTQNLANRGGGLYFGETASGVITNSIVWDNAGSELFAVDEDLDVSYSDIEGGWPGEQNLDADPLFVDPANNDFHLAAGSPVIDQALADAAPPEDIDGNVRPGGPGFDMGSDEFYGPPQILDVPGGFGSIQAAIDAAFNGDQVVLAPGVYVEANISYNGKAVTVRSTDPSDPAVVAATVIDGGGAGTVFSFINQETDQSVLSGVTVTGGLAPTAGGILIDNASPLIDRCIITGNIASAGLGGGLYGVASNSRIVETTFSANQAIGCGDPNLCGNGGGLYMVDGLPTLEDSVFDGNEAEAAGGGVYVTSGTILGLSVLNNSADQGAGIYAINSKIQNSTVGPNNAATREGGGLYCQDSEVRDTMVDGNSASKGGGLVLTDSDMVDSIVTGNNATEEGGGTWLGEVFFSTLEGNTTDGDGGGGSDISLLRESFIRDNIAGNRGGGLFNAQIVRETEVTGNQAERGGGAFVQNGLADESSMTDSVLDNNSATFGGGIAMQALWPPPHWADINTIRLTNTTVNGNDATSQGGGLYCEECIARLLSTDVMDNTAGFQGGGLYITPTVSPDARPSLSVEAASIIRNSSLEEGGAMFCGEAAVAELASAEIWGNTAASGAGFYSDSCDLELTNVTVSANTASGEGGAILTTSSEDSSDRPKIVNSILWGNTPDEIIVVSLGLPEVRFSDVFGGWPGEGNIEVDPLFVNADPINGDFHLTRISPVIDDGDTSMAPDQDVDRGARVIGVAVDLGADEFRLDDPEVDGIPTITSVFPTQGSVVGGETVTISGQNFGGFSQVFFGSREAEVISIAIDELQVLSPSSFIGVGFVDVKVTNFDDFDAVRGGAYEYILPPVPVPLSVNPSTGSLDGLEDVTISGQNFTSPMTVTFGLNNATSVVVVSSTVITAKTPPGDFGGPVDVVVEDQYDQTGVLLDGFSYDGPIPPQVDTVTPNSGGISGGLPVSITGDFFTADVEVFFGANQATTIIFVTPQEVQALTPASNVIGPVDVIVRDTLGQDGVLADGFEYLPEVDPQIFSLSPSSGSTAGGDTVTINGQGFADPMILQVDGAETRLTFVDTETLTFITPPHAAAEGCANDVVEIKVTRNDDKEATDNFTYQPVQVLNVDPGDSIQAAVNAAANGACIRIAENDFPGYLENINVGAKVIAIYGEFPNEPARTVINGSGSNQPVIEYNSNPGPGTLLRGVSLVLGNGGVEVNSSSPVLEDLIIQDNERTGDGGGIGIFGSTSAPVIRNSFVSLNSATSQGGGIYLTSGAEMTLEGNVVSLNSAEEGGGIWIGNDNTLDLSGQTVEYNEASEQEGGGLFLGSRSTTTLTNAEIVGNTSVMEGAGIYLGADAFLDIIDTTIDDNVSADHAGGIWVGDASELTLSGGSVSGNIAGFRDLPPSQGNGSGAGIYVDIDAIVDIRNALFEGNSGNSEISEGGAIWLGDFVNGTFSGNRLVDNQAQIGGAMVLRSKSDVVVEGNEVACNFAVQNAEPDNPLPPKYYAPGIYANDSQSVFYNNTISNNVGSDATSQTGGLHIVEPFLLPEVVNNIFSSNSGYGLFCGPGASLGRLDYNLYFDNEVGDAANCTPGGNAVFDDPTFVDPSCPNPDLNLMPGSPAIDAGDPTFDVPPGGGVIIDIGANEFGA